MPPKIRKILKNNLKKLLRLIAVLVIKKYNPEIVGVTGSIGKSSTVSAIYAVLSSTYSVQKSLKNYNNEIGIPLSIIGSASGERSVIKWLGVFMNVAKLLLFKDEHYPQILILEMGADRPGDIKYLTDFVPLKVAVVTSVSNVHIEFFETVDRIAKEKSQLVKALDKNGFAVLNHDDLLVAKMNEKTQASSVSYGYKSGADVSASEIAISHDIKSKDLAAISGISFKLSYKGNVIPILLPNVLGEHLVYSALAAAAVGIVFDLNLHTISDALRSFEPPKGRMHLLEGIKKTAIIDDTYNSSPLAVEMALKQLSSIKSKEDIKKFAVLGDMLELGSQSVRSHTEAGQRVKAYGIDYLITVGPRSVDTVRGAVMDGMSEDRCFNFDTSEEAGRFLQDRIETGDIILVKGSQGMRMEKVVKEIMAEPNRAVELLVRQDGSWLN